MKLRIIIIIIILSSSKDKFFCNKGKVFGLHLDAKNYIEGLDIIIPNMVTNQ
jgi:hypothetical protein